MEGEDALQPSGPRCSGLGCLFLLCPLQPQLPLLSAALSALPQATHCLLHFSVTASCQGENVLVEAGPIDSEPQSSAAN